MKKVKRNTKKYIFTTCTKFDILLEHQLLRKVDLKFKTSISTTQKKTLKTD